MSFYGFVIKKWLMENEMESKKEVERARSLFRKRREVLSMAPEKALEKILESPQPAALIHSFPAEDFYFLVNDVGPEDALPVLSLASDRQWEYVLDLEGWQRDRIDMSSVSRWFALLFQADPRRFVGRFLDEHMELAEFFLDKNLEVRMREHDQDPSDFGEGFFTLDDVYYFRSKTEKPDTESGQIETDPKTRQEFLAKFLKELSEYDRDRFQRIVLNMGGALPAETEEEQYRLRGVRLAESGFLPFEEAVGIYQPIKPEALKTRQIGKRPAEEEASLLPRLPLIPFRVLEQENLFTGALSAIESDAVLERIQSEFASLSNQIVVADHKTVRDRESLREVVQKACGYINIGLARLCPEEGEAGFNRLASLVQRHCLVDLFRVGYGLALELKWRAEKWRPESWFQSAGLPLGFWGESWLGVLGGLLIKKPLYFDNYRKGRLYREFESLEDIRETERVLNHIIYSDRLLSAMEITIEPMPETRITYKNLVLTIWARHSLGLSRQDATAPIRIDQFRVFFENLFEAPPGKPPRVAPGMKESLHGFLAERTGLAPAEITQGAGQVLEDLFREMESELGQVDSTALDSRHIHLFLLKTERSSE